MVWRLGRHKKVMKNKKIKKIEADSPLGSSTGFFCTRWEPIEGFMGVCFVDTFWVSKMTMLCPASFVLKIQRGGGVCTGNFSHEKISDQVYFATVA